MPLHNRSKNRHEQSISQDKSSQQERSSKRIIHRPKENNPNYQYCQGNSQRKQRQKTNRQRSMSKNNQTNKCTRCQAMKLKLKEQESHFRQLISVHHLQIEALEKINLDLREEMDLLEARARKAEAEVEEMKAEASYSSKIQELENPYQHFPSISPVGQPKGFTIIKKLGEGERSTFSQLLVTTPQSSQLGPNPFQPGQKQTALRSEFERLMNQWTAASNRSRKMALRKQLAAIANQLSTLSSDIIRQ